MGTNRPIGVGIIGANPQRGWATVAHIPALAAMPETFQLKAISTSRPESAAESAGRYGVPGYADPHALIAHPGVDLVAITVKVPAHRALVDAALDAGKMVYCEWPLGNGLADAEAMAAHARSAGVKTVIGLQAHTAPLLRYMGDLVRQGYVGEVLSTTLTGSGSNWGPRMLQANAYTADDANGATMLSIPIGHTLQALLASLGDFTGVTALSAVRRKTLTIIETGAPLELKTPDQWSIAGTLSGGAFATVHYRGGVARGTNLRWEINGTEGDLLLTAGPGGAQMASQMELFGGQGDSRGLEALPLPGSYVKVSGLVGPPFNVGHLYQAFAMDLATGSHEAPDFDDAVKLHRLLDAVTRAADTGERQRLG